MHCLFVDVLVWLYSYSVVVVTYIWLVIGQIKLSVWNRYVETSSIETSRRNGNGNPRVHVYISTCEQTIGSTKSNMTYAIPGISAIRIVCFFPHSLLFFPSLSLCRITTITSPPGPHTRPGLVQANFSHANRAMLARLGAGSQERFSDGGFIRWDGMVLFWLCLGGSLLLGGVLFSVGQLN